MTPGSSRQSPVPPEDNPFALLRLAPRWALAQSDLRAAHLRLAVRLHPDRFAPGSASEAAAAELARVNEAAALLSDPLRRAQILLALGGGAPTPAPTTEFLGRILGWRDELQDPAQAEAARAAGRAELTAIGSGLDAAFAALLGPEESAACAGAELRAQVASLIVHWKYLRRLLEEGGV